MPSIKRALINNNADFSKSLSLMLYDRDKFHKILGIKYQVKSGISINLMIADFYNISSQLKSCYISLNHESFNKYIKDIYVRAHERVANCNTQIVGCK